MNDIPPSIEEATADHSKHGSAIYCPSCAARVVDSALSGQELRCPVCGTQFEVSTAESSESAIIKSDTTLSSNAILNTFPLSKRLSTEQILLDRLTKEPPIKKQAPWTVVALIVAVIIGVSFAIFKNTQKPDIYAPGQQVDSTVLLQKQLFFQHIVDSLQQQLVANPQDIHLHLLLADAYYDSGEWALSRKEFLTYLKVRPEDADARVDYAYAIAQGGNLNAAISEIDTALTYDPDHLNALVNAGILTAQTINDTNHVIQLARARSYFERAKAVAEKTDPKTAAKIDTLQSEINRTGARMGNSNNPQQ